MSNTEFKAAYGRNKVSKMDNIIFYCRGGSRSSMAYEMSMDAGFTRAQNFIGGWLSWSDCQEGGCHVRGVPSKVNSLRCSGILYSFISFPSLH